MAPPGARGGRLERFAQEPVVHGLAAGREDCTGPGGNGHWQGSAAGWGTGRGATVEAGGLRDPPGAGIVNHMVKQATPLDGVFRALADPTRRSIVARLARGPATIGELGEPFDMTKPARNGGDSENQLSGFLPYQL